MSTDDRPIAPEIAELARQVRRLQREMRGQARGSQAAFRSVELRDGTVSYYDADGTERLQIGPATDGTFMVRQVNAPPPPTPTEPGVLGVPSGIRVGWDGTFIEANRPADIDYVEVHVSDNPGFTANDETQVGAFSSEFGGTLFYPVRHADGFQYIKLVAKNYAGVESLPSDEAFAQAELVAAETDGEVPTAATGLEATGGIRSVFLSWEHVDNHDLVDYLVYAGTAPGFAHDALHFVGRALGNRATVYRVYDDASTSLVDISPDDTYYFVVVAEDGDGAGDPSGEVAGTAVKVDSPDIAVNAIQPVHISDDAITAAKIADEAVTTAKIALDAITDDLIAAGAVGSSELANDAVTAVAIADGAVATAKIALDAITAALIADDAVTADALADAAVTAAAIADDAITSLKIADDAITAAKIATDAVTADAIAAAAVTETEIADDSITTPKIVAGAVTADEIGANAVTAVKILAGSVVADKIAAGAITTDKLTVASIGDSLIHNGNFADVNPGTNTPMGWNINDFGYGVSAFLRDVAGNDTYAQVTTNPAGPVGIFQAGLGATQLPASVGDQFFLELGVVSTAAGGFWIPALYCYDRDGGWLGAVYPNGGAGFAAGDAAAALPSSSRHGGAVTIPYPTVAYCLTAVHLMTAGTTYYLDKYTVAKVQVSARIADGSITTPKVVAGAITANEIAANAVTATKIQAGAVTTEKLTVGAIGDDMVPNGNLEDINTVDPQVAAKFSKREVAGTHVTYDMVGSAASGTRCQAIIKAAASGIDYGALVTSPIPVVAGRTYLPTVRQKAAGGSAFHIFRVFGYHADMSSEIILVDDWGAVTSTTWEDRVVAPITIPADVAFVALCSYHYGPNSDPGAVTLFLDDFQLRPLVLSAQISDGAITTPKLVTDAVTAAKIQAGAVTAGKIAANAVTANEIAADAVTAVKILAGAVTAGKIAANAVTATAIAADAVTAVKILAGAVTAGKIAADAVTANEIAANAVTASEIATDAVTATKIVAGAVSADKIAANAVSTDKLAANAVTADKILANEITADKFASTLALVSTLLVGDRISIRPTDSAVGVTDNGIRIELLNGGHIYLPADGTAADFSKVSARFTSATIEDNLSILGGNNTLGGVLKAKAAIPAPSTAPAVISVGDPAPLSFSATALQTVGLGWDPGTSKWLVGEYTDMDSLGNGHVRPVAIDPSTGARTTGTSRAVTPNDASGSGPWPQPTFCSYHGIALGVDAFIWRHENWGPNFPGGPTGTAWYVVDVGSTGGAHVQWSWKPVSSFNKPAIFRDATYVYIAAVSTSGVLTVYRYDPNGANETLLWSSSGWGNATNLAGLFHGDADYGAGTNGWVITTDGAGIFVFNSTGALQSANNWVSPDASKGLAWNGTRFATHTTATKIRLHSTNKVSTARSSKYTWYNATTGTESTASSASSVAQDPRKWLQVTSAAIPGSTNPAAPDSVRLYVDAHRQAALAVGATTAVYEAPSTSFGDAPGVNGFASLSTFGQFQSEATDPNGFKYWDLRGDGTIYVRGVDLANPPHFKGALTNVSQAVAANTPVPYSSIENLIGSWSGSLFQWTVPIPGQYRITYGFKINGTASAPVHQIRGGSGGTTVRFYQPNIPSAAFGGGNFSWEGLFAAGDKISIHCWQNTYTTQPDGAGMENNFVTIDYVRP